jgi:hypothetical protein
MQIVSFGPKNETANRGTDGKTIERERERERKRRGKERQLDNKEMEADGK